jgi:hypothetical protein
MNKFTAIVAVGILVVSITGASAYIALDDGLSIDSLSLEETPAQEENNSIDLDEDQNSNTDSGEKPPAPPSS